MSLLGAVLLALGCGGGADGPPQRFEDCADPACRRAWVEGRLAQDPAAVVAPLVALADPVEQVALVELVVEARPGSNHVLCDALAPGAAKRRCETLNARMHLVDRAPEHRLGPARRAPGPSSWRLDLRGLPPSPLLGAVPPVLGCAAEQEPRRCFAQASRGPAALGHAREASGACMGIEAGQWRDECHFQASEVVLRNRRDEEGMGAAVDLCLMAGAFADNCFGHIALRLSEDVVPVDAATAQDWQALAARAEALDAILRDRGMSAQAEAMAALFWAETMAVAFTAARRISGEALDHLPPAARPHVHAAAAAALVRGQVSAQVPSLAGLLLALQQDLARREAPTGQRREGGRGWRPREDLWPQDGPQDLDIPAVVYLGASRRALAAEDPAADLKICLLEAWVRIHPESGSVLAEGARDPMPLVAWTARRLLDPPPGGMKAPPPGGRMASPPGGRGPG